MKKLVLATMAIVLFVSNTKAQERLSTEDKERLQEIVKKVSSVAEEKARVVAFELNYKENFELANFAVDEESELEKKLSSSLDEPTFNSLKGNIKLTYGNGDFVVFITDDMNNIGNAILAHAKQRPVNGLYVPRSLDKGAGAHFPYGCRTWTVGFSLGLDLSTEITLCCVPANWRTPPISCTEVISKNSSGNEIVYQYIMVDEIEKNLDKKIESDKIEVFNEKPLETEDGNYSLKRDFYAIQVNERNERFIQLQFEKIK